MHVSEEAGSDSDDESARSAGARFGRVSVASWEERGATRRHIHWMDGTSNHSLWNCWFLGISV